MSDVTDNYGLILPEDGEGYDVEIINQNNITIDALLLTLSKQAKGIVASDKEDTADSGAITAIASISSGIATFPFKGGRVYEIVYTGNFYTTNIDSIALVQIGTCAVADAQNLTTGVTVLNQTDYKAETTNRGYPMNLIAQYEPGADTTLQIKVLVQRISGTGNIHMQRSATAPHILKIRDCGDQL
jgi:hypothetical protein